MQNISETKFSFLVFALRSAGVVALLFALSSVAMAQSTATLQGLVTDASNAAVPGATVLIHNQGTGVDVTTKTDQAGDYVMPGLLPGLYTITFNANGFQSFVIKDLKLDVATTVTENAQLKVGEVTQEVVVNGGTPLVNPSSISVSQVITQKTVQEIPLNGRHFLDLANLTPGTMTAPQNGFLVSPLQGLGALSIDTAGQRETTVNLLVNGVNLNDEVQNQATFQPSIDTVSEFKIDNSTFPAQYGRNSGAIINIATRSGTNDYHGEAFDFLRNNYFDARNFFNPVGTTQSPLNRNDFGGDFGGPVKKNKAFFFASYEGLRQLHALPLEVSVPGTGTTSSNTVVNSLLTLLAKDAPANGTLGGQPAFFGSTNAPVNVDIGTGDLDFNLTSNDQFHGYYAIEKDHRFEPTSATNVPGFGDTRDGSRQLLTLSESHIFNPDMTNQVRLGFNRLHITFLPNDSNLTPSSFGIGLPATVPNVGLPSIVIQGLPSGVLEFGNPGGEPQGRGDTTVAFNDTMTWLKGKHTVDFGVDISRFYNNNIGENVGSFTFSSLTNFLNDGAAAFSTLEGNSDNKVLMPSWGAFVQDSYKWKPNLTFNVGLRYDWNGTPTEAANRFAVFDPSSDSLVTIGTPGFGQVFPTNNKLFQPRVGLAWDPWGDGKTAVRVGYAILDQQPTTNVVSGLTGNPPFAVPLASSSATNSITLEAPPTNPKTVSPFTVDPNYHDAYVQDWNVTIQRELTNTLGIQVAYVGSKATHLQQEVNLNQPAVVAGVFGVKTAAPYANFSEIPEVTSNGNSNYNALWVTAKKQATHGLEFLATYTWSKSLDYASLDFPNVLPQDSNNLQNEYGPSDFDARNRFVLSGFYSLPFKGNRAISGWQVAVVTQAQSGNPLTAYMSGVSGLFPGAVVRPNVTGPIDVTGNPSNWIANPGVFTNPCSSASGTLVCAPGNEGRNSIIGPDFVDTDFSLIKDTKITERVTSEFRAEAFDIFNHPNFGDPNFVFNAATGTALASSVINSTRFPTGDFGSSRQLQFALKLIF
ncbi:MAG TPA: carboxypeptidase regulatory-like domain-containing protein [Candidatus Acidoferrales bacterium]|nr:carboxypeptidase regulatory-like domain-containing protein [Candidatus Acidoferrales bacterium]